MFHRLSCWMESLFEPPQTNALQDAIAALEHSEKQALTEQSEAEYAAAQVICHNAMAEYHKKRIARLQAYVAAKTHDNTPKPMELVVKGEHQPYA